MAQNIPGYKEYSIIDGDGTMAEEKIKLSPEIEQLTEKLLADPKSRVFAQLADAYRKCGMLDEAIETAKKGLEIHPQYAVAHLILGRCYMAKKMYALAREEFELTVKNDPQNLVGFRLLAETYERQSMYPEAVKYYQMVLDLDPANFDVAEKIESLRKYIKPILPEQQVPVWSREPEPAAAMPKAEPEPAAVQPEAEAPAVAFPTTEPVPPEPEAGPAPSPAETETPPLEILSVAAATLEEKTESQAAAEPAATEEEKPAQSTATLAELYASQGHLEQAIEAYRELIASEPQNQAYKDRLDQLLAQAFPEESAGTKERPSPESEKAAEAQAVELTGLFAEMEKAVTQAAAEPEVAPAEPSPVEMAAAPGSKEPEAVTPAPEPKAPDLTALFSDVAPAKESAPEQPSQIAEPQPPEPEAKKEEPKEDAVSSFQAWLRSIQG